MPGLLNALIALVASIAAALAPPAGPEPTTPDQSAPAQPPAVQPENQQPAADQPVTDQPPASIESVDDLLEALEVAGREIHSLVAKVQYTKVFAIEGDEQIRRGELFYVATPQSDQDTPADAAAQTPPVRKFAVHFTWLKVGGRIDDDQPKSYIFDGQWMLELDPVLKQYERRQVVPPGERFDPLRLGEGPFPLPIGQSRAEILERFDAQLVEPADAWLEDERLIAWVDRAPTYQLHLVPKAAYADELDLVDVRLWYRADSLLPTLAWTETAEGNESIVQLVDIRLNVPVPAGKIDTTPPTGGWDGRIVPLRERVEASP